MKVVVWSKWLSPFIEAMIHYLVLSKMRVASRIMVLHPPICSIQNEGDNPEKWPELVRTAPTPAVLKCYKNQHQVAFPPCLVLYKRRVASRIMGPSPRSGSIQTEGGIPDHGAIPSLSSSIQTEGGILDQVVIPLVWFYST